MAETFDLEEMTVEELEQHIQQLDERKQEIRQAQRTAHEVLDRKNAAVVAQAKLETMSDPEKQALVQAIQAEGIPSQEAVGSPGGADEG